MLTNLIADGIITGSAYALVAVSFGLILSVTGRFHFAWGLTYTLAAYIAIEAADKGIPLILAMLLGVLASAVLGVAIELLVYQRVAQRSRANALFAIFVTSLGLTTAGVAVLQLCTPAESAVLPGVNATPISVIGAHFTNLDVYSVGVSWALITAFAIGLRKLRLGRRIRGVQANPEMAKAVGISVPRTYGLVFGLASLLCGVSAILYTASFAATPDMGSTPVFDGFVLVFLAGVSAPPIRVALVGLTIGIAESLSTLWLSPSLSSVVVFVILLVYLGARAAGVLAFVQRGLTRRRMIGLAAGDESMSEDALIEPSHRE